MTSRLRTGLVSATVLGLVCLSVAARTNLAEQTTAGPVTPVILGLKVGTAALPVSDNQPVPVLDTNSIAFVSAGGTYMLVYQHPVLMLGVPSSHDYFYVNVTKVYGNWIQASYAAAKDGPKAGGPLWFNLSNVMAISPPQ